MRRYVPLVGVIAVLFAGCGGSSLEAGLPEAPHKGNLVAIGDGKGYVEILMEGGTGARGSKAQNKPRIAAYFYQADAVTAISPAPTDVTVKVGTGATSPVLALAPAPQDATKFLSEPTTFPDGFRGEISFKLGAESLASPFTIR